MEASSNSLPVRDFSEAKTQLSEVMTTVVHEHIPTVVTRHRGKELMVLLDPEALRPLLGRFTFTTRASVSDGEFVLRQPELGLIAGGDTFDAAAEELEELVAAYAEEFFERFDFFRHTDRAEHLPYLLRMMLAKREDWRELLIPAPELQPTGA